MVYEIFSLVSFSFYVFQSAMNKKKRLINERNKMLVIDHHLVELLPPGTGVELTLKNVPVFEK